MYILVHTTNDDEQTCWASRKMNVCIRRRPVENKP